MRKMAFLTIATLLAIGLLASAAGAQKLCFEAEHYTWIKPSMTLASDQDVSNGQIVYVPLRANHGADEQAPTDTGNTTYKIYIPTEATWYLWGRCWWYDDCGNSFFVFMDQMDQENPPYLTDSTLRKYHWVRGKGYSLTVGWHLIRFQNREDGARLDQFLLTTTPPDQWTPSGKQTETPQYLYRPQ